LCDPINYHENITATAKIFYHLLHVLIGKLLASCYSKLREGINVPINLESVATILIACIICEQHASNNIDTGGIWVSTETLFAQALLLKTENKGEITFIEVLTNYFY